MSHQPAGFCVATMRKIEQAGKSGKGDMKFVRVSRAFCMLLSITVSSAAFAAPQSHQKSAPERSGVIGGVHFVKHVIADSQQGGMPAAAIYLPESWHLESKIEWNYGWTEVPLAFSLRAENLANQERSI
jgi:hypothetical protein